MSRIARHSWLGVYSRKVEEVELRDDWAVDLHSKCPEEGASQDIMHELIRLAQQEKAQGREIARLRERIEKLEAFVKAADYYFANEDGKDVLEAALQYDLARAALGKDADGND